MDRESRMTKRRKEKFEKHAIRIEKENAQYEMHGSAVTVHFKWAVYAGKALIGRATTYRSALKRAHRHIRLKGA